MTTNNQNTEAIREVPEAKSELTHKLYRQPVTYEAFQLWHCLNDGQQPSSFIPEPCAALQTTEQLSKSSGIWKATPESIEAATEELLEKHLIRIEDYRGKRFLNTTTYRTSGPS